jgi:hypothetical protein
MKCGFPPARFHARNPPGIHPEKPDGILFPSRHELSVPSCAIFEHNGQDLKWERWGSLDEPTHAAKLSTLMRLGGLGLDL